jgi:diguanylate cyclase (GGDEF)-like protein
MTRLDRLAQWHWEQDATLRFSRVESVDATREVIGQSMLGKTWSHFEAAYAGDEAWIHHLNLLRQREPFFNFELKITRTEREYAWLSLSGVPVHDSNGVFMGYRGVGRDITGLKIADETIARLTLNDQLTGLGNRRLLLDRLAFARISGVRSQEIGALIYVDIDQFKVFNDVVGHDLADTLLIEVGARLVGCVRDCDTVTRLGGDVFVILVTNLGCDSGRAYQNLQRVVNKVSTALELPFPTSLDIALRTSAHAPHFSCSMGVCLFQGVDTQIEDIMKRAELALLQAKQDGRKRVRYFDAQVEEQVNHRAQMEADLHVALRTGQFRLFYQPIVGMAKNVIGYEALVRWQHHTLGLLAPGVFIDVAEQSGLIVPLGEWILATACSQLLEFQSDPEKQHLTIAVNLSARQLVQADIVDVVTRILTDSGVPANRLKLEITESMLLNDIDTTAQKIKALCELGIQFALDDFGTGYSSLGYLKKLSLRQLKIDHSFVKGLLTEPVDAAIVRTIIQLARSLGMSVISEGVELEGQRKVLADMGCNEFQGYLFGRPAPMPLAP